MKLFFLSIGLVLGQLAQAQSFDKSSLSLPDTLKKNADAVFLVDDYTVEIQSGNYYVGKTHQVISILNKDGLHHLNKSFYVDKFHKLDEVEIKIMNAFGVEVKKFKKKDFSFTGAMDESTLFTDGKTMYLEAFSPSLPCTVEITSEEHVSSFIELPDYYIGEPDEAVLHGSFTVKTLPENDIRFRVRNYKLAPVISTENKYKVYKWEVSNVYAKKGESNTYSLSYYWPKIEIVPTNFEYDGYKGSLADWKSFGKWNYDLYTEPIPFTPERQAALKQLVAGVKTDKEKISILYNYLQDNWRYVSVQLGIGGFKPFAVDFVDKKKYGDCKALTNFMRYMLAAVDIKAYPALINARYNNPPAEADFPTDVFNHVILCVPMAKDSVWLECTSKNNEPGVLGSFTENKKALLLTEAGGVLVNTPTGDYHNNIFSTKTIVNVNEDGGGITNTTLYCRGEFRDVYDEMKQRIPDERKTLLINYYYFRTGDFTSIENFRDSANGKVFTSEDEFRQLYDFKAGSKHFVQPLLHSLVDKSMPAATDRKQPFLFHYPYQKTDTTVYVLGKFFEPGSALPDKKFENEYASYTMHAEADATNGTLTIISNMVLRKNIIPAADYSKMASFFASIAKAENDKLVLVKK